MSFFSSNRLSSPWVAALLALVLVALAWLQYRWIGEVSQAERERLDRGLTASASLMRRDFNRELQRLAEDYWIDPRGRTDVRSVVVSSFDRRRQAGGDALPLESLYLRTRNDGAAPTVERLSFSSLEFELAELPAELREVGEYADRRRRGGPRPGAWTLHESGVLAAGLVAVQRERNSGRARLEHSGEIYLRLDMEALRNGLLLDLTDRYFGATQEARVAVLANDQVGAKVLFGDEAGWEATDAAAPEILMPLLWTREESGRETADRLRDRFGRRPDDLFRPPGGVDPDPDRRRRPGGGRGGGRGSLFESGTPVANIGRAGPDGWVLAVGTVAGSLDDLVERTRRRNLVVSFGVLILLGAGLALVLVSTRRAQRLAEMQMEFVAGVSHELRTPLAVIRSAGENLAEGVVSSPEQVREYGGLVRDQGRRLTEMVEQTLELAGAQAGKRVVSPEELDLSGLVDETLASMPEIVVEKTLPADLPHAWADPHAVQLALRNLLENAQKYGGPSKWIGLEGRVNGDRVELRVRDRGPGIGTEDLTHLFEPFYRGRRALAEQARGAGLGLSLASDAVQSSGGTLTVESRVGEGSVFTIQLPQAGKEDE